MTILKKSLPFRFLLALGCTSPSIALAQPNAVNEPLAVPEDVRMIAEAQVLLDRAGHSPGVIDGSKGGNTSQAIRAFYRANGMAVAPDAVTPALLQALRARSDAPPFQTYTISESDVAGPFVAVPGAMEDQAALETLAFESPAEALAEKFHMAQSLLRKLNPNADFSAAGTTILVASPQQPALKGKVARIEVDKAAAELRAFDKEGTILATYPATVGSSTFPSPDGSMTVRTVAPAPTYHFNPEGRDWGPDKALVIAAGPNNPVGGTWIDLTKEGYGIHGTPDPRLIGKTASHGCVRLTNWDAEELSKAVEAGTEVVFV